MSTETDKYLLRAPKAQMTAWKNEARKRKIPFSQFCREVLDAAIEKKVGVRTPTALPSADRVERAVRASSARAATERATGRPFRPDFKK